MQFSRGGQIGVFGSAPDPPGPKKGPFGATHAKNGIDRLEANGISVV